MHRRHRLGHRPQLHRLRSALGRRDHRDVRRRARLPRSFDRFWRIIEKYRVNIFYTSPTAIRALIRQGDQWPNAHDLSSLRLLGSVGEPINPAAWEWYHHVIGKERCPIVDTWWQTETGAIMIAPMPGAVPLKPGSGTLPLPGVDADVVDLAGNPVGADQEGFLIIRRPWPACCAPSGAIRSATRTSTGTACPACTSPATPRAATRTATIWMLGRVDDVMNVSGHRLSTMEVESALVRHPAVAEAAVVGKPHEITGQAVCAFVTLKTGNCGPRDAGRGTAPVGGARNRQLRPAGGDPLHRRAAQNAQRQDHAPPAARDRHHALGDRRRHHARGHGRGHAPGGAARRGVGRDGGALSSVEGYNFHSSARGRARACSWARLASNSSSTRCAAFCPALFLEAPSAEPIHSFPTRTSTVNILECSGPCSPTM